MGEKDPEPYISMSSKSSDPGPEEIQPNSITALGSGIAFRSPSWRASMTRSQRKKDLDTTSVVQGKLKLRIGNECSGRANKFQRHHIRTRRGDGQ